MMYRIVSLRSLNVDNQESMFGVVKSITKATSDNHPHQVIDNGIQRMQYEEDNRSSTGICEESEISALSLVAGPRKNTVFSHNFQHKFATHYQAHLEHISNFLVAGPGVWWKETSEGVDF